jgi:hypothetical protein
MVKKCHVVSPDGFPITPKPFKNEKEAIDYIPQWCKRFKEQGYYAAVGFRIPLNELPHYLKIVSADKVLSFPCNCQE